MRTFRLPSNAKDKENDLARYIGIDTCTCEFLFIILVIALPSIENASPLLPLVIWKKTLALMPISLSLAAYVPIYNNNIKSVNPSKKIMLEN